MVNINLKDDVVMCVDPQRKVIYVMHLSHMRPGIQELGIVV